MSKYKWDYPVYVDVEDVDDVDDVDVALKGGGVKMMITRE